MFRATGYLPIFPMIFSEKAAALLSGGESGKAADQKTVFRPGLAARGAAGVLSAVSQVTEVVGRNTNKVTDPAHRDVPVRESAGCERPWTLYCESMTAAIEFARGHGIDVLVVGQPEMPAFTSGRVRHDHQQQELAAMIERRFGNDARVRYASMRGVVDTADPQISFDLMHLTAEGNAVLGRRLALYVREFLARRAG